VTAVDVSGSVEGCDQATVALVKLVFLKDDTIVGQEGVPIEQPMKRDEHSRHILLQMHSMYKSSHVGVLSK
jgi:hypothetical protein